MSLLTLGKTFIEKNTFKTVRQVSDSIITSAIVPIYGRDNVAEFMIKPQLSVRARSIVTPSPPMDQFELYFTIADKFDFPPSIF